MKNYEKYADEIKGYNGDSICTDFIEPYILKSINAKCINTSCPKCRLYRTIWLMEEIRPKKCKMVDGRLQGGFPDHDSDAGQAIDSAIEALEKVEAL